MITTDIDVAVAALRSGKLVGLPTETVYGLAADAADEQAVAKVFAAKGRPPSHPLIVHVASAGWITRYAVDVPAVAKQLAEQFWPGPLTILLKRSALVPDAVTGGRDTVALRAPAHSMALSLIESFGAGVVAPSANRFGKVSPTEAKHVEAELGNAVDVILDGGRCLIGIESTIVDCTTNTPRLLRPGHVTAAQLEAVVGCLAVADAASEAVAPGMLPSHYAPQAKVVLVEDNDSARETRRVVAELLAAGKTVGVFGPEPIGELPQEVVQLAPGGDPTSYAHVLYARLREADEHSLDVLVVVPPEAVGSGIAVRDRLRRAAYE